MRRVVLGLPSVRGEALAEVAGAIQQTDADQRQPEIRGGLEVVTGEDPEATRIVGQYLGDAEFHGEVGDSGRHRVPGRHLMLVPAGPVEVVVEVRGGGVEPGEEVLVRGEFVEPGGGRPHRAGGPDRARPRPTGARRSRRTGPAWDRCQDHRRLVASEPSAFNRSGKVGTNVESTQALSRVRTLPISCAFDMTSERTGYRHSPRHATDKAPPAGLRLTRSRPPGPRPAQSTTSRRNGAIA